MTSMNGINNLKISNAAIRKGCKRQEQSHVSPYANEREIKNKGFINKEVQFHLH